MAKKSITGISLRAGGLEWTCLKSADADRWQVDGSGVDSHPLMDAWPSWEEALKHSQVAVEGDVRLVLPAEGILLRVMTLPTIEQDEILGMVDLQLDDFSPFPLEQLYVGYEVLHEDEQQSCVVVAAVKRKSVDLLGEALGAVGARVSRIDVDLLCWWDVLKPKDGEGRRIHLIREERSLGFVVSDDGLPVHMGFVELLEPESKIAWQDVGEDLEMALLSVEAEYGGAEVVGVEVWHHAAAPVGVQLLEDVFGWPVSVKTFPDQHTLSELAVRRGFVTDAAPVNLIPEAWTKAEATRLVKKKLLMVAVSMAVLWLFFAGLGALLVQLGKSKALKLESRIAAIEAPARQVEEMRRKIQSLSQFTNQTYSALECLRETTVLLPPDIELLQWTYHKARGVTLKGKAQNSSPAFTYNGLLAESVFFGEVVNNGGSMQRGSWMFTVSALLPEGEAE